ncbi:MAG: transcriptional repressor [Intrasporangium sp.]|uniref:Fur family transcriptional regulator n=1 Tax=Intrasporangium sp. TaxID=1925024 RepID=UPI002648F65F|nr:transcriptional repressor [Intrasporangium sp.]MDN5797532.1 transcriptional repressor [Intrasporangium sp.]
MEHAGPTPRVATALARLRELGERVTPARRAVLEVVDAADRADEHLTAEQIGARVAELEPSTHRATLYRVLTSLCDAGVLSHIHVGGNATVYHLAGHPSRTSESGSGTAAYAPGEGPAHGHAHVRCLVCGRVQDAPTDVLAVAADRLRATLGFEIDTGHVALLGTCARCTGSQPG